MRPTVQRVYDQQFNVYTTDRSTCIRPIFQRVYDQQFNMYTTDRSTCNRPTVQRVYDRQINVYTTDWSTCIRPTDQRVYGRQFNVYTADSSTCIRPTVQRVYDRHVNVYTTHDSTPTHYAADISKADSWLASTSSVDSRPSACRRTRQHGSVFACGGHGLTYTNTSANLSRLMRVEPTRTRACSRRRENKHNYCFQSDLTIRLRRYIGTNKLINTAILVVYSLRYGSDNSAWFWECRTVFSGDYLNNYSHPVTMQSAVVTLPGSYASNTCGQQRICTQQYWSKLGLAGSYATNLIAMAPIYAIVASF